MCWLEVFTKTRGKTWGLGPMLTLPPQLGKKQVARATYFHPNFPPTLTRTIQYTNRSVRSLMPFPTSYYTKIFLTQAMKYKTTL